MTFDEALEELRLAIPEKFYSPTMHDIAVILEAQTKVINLLRQEYAPTVEMTKRQARVFKLYYDSEKPFDKSEFECIDNYFMKSINEKDLMRAWLHPEIIKVVDE